MAKHRAPDLPEPPPSRWEHVGWWVVLLLWVMAGLFCIGVGFVGCLGWLVGG